MENQLVERPQSANLDSIEKALMQGDLSKLNPEQKLCYYKMVCEAVGLNPLTKPFEYMRLNNKEVLYAGKNCAEQLRKIHKISIYKMETHTDGDTYQVVAYARMADGREDSSLGAVPIAGLKGETLANAKMKCETKAKRRVTLSIVGLGMLDETEVNSIEGIQKMRQVGEENENKQDAKAYGLTGNIVEPNAQDTKGKSEEVQPKGDRGLGANADLGGEGDSKILSLGETKFTAGTQHGKTFSQLFKEEVTNGHQWAKARIKNIEEIKKLKQPEQDEKMKHIEQAVNYLAYAKLLGVTF